MAGFAWAAVLSSFLVLGVGVSGQIPGLPQLPECTSPPNVFRPPPITVKIFCRQNPDLNVAVRVNNPDDASQNEVVLAAKADRTDTKQLWQVIYPPVGALTDDEDRYPPFVLVNFATRQAMVNKHIPVPADDNLVHVQLAPYNPCLTKVSTLWTMGDNITTDGYSEIRALRNVRWVLDGLRDNVQDGTFVGIFPSKTPEGDNALWKIDSAFP